MDLASVNTPVAALLAGLVTSLHCVGMCGPLACMLAPSREERTDPLTVAATYHLSRLFGYALLGALAGGLGALPAGWLGSGWTLAFPWLLVAYFVAVALGLGRWTPRGLLKPLWLSTLPWKLRGWLAGKNRVLAAGTVGLATPLLPCGPLYFLVALATFSGSALGGAEFLLAFGLGTVPLLWILQANHGWLARKVGPVGLARARAGLALVTALVLAWRLRPGGPDWETFVCH